MSRSSKHELTVERYAEAQLPTRFGPFRVVVYRERDGDKEHLAVIAGDCRDQLDLALERIQAAGKGAVLYLRQEGRGIGLGNKIRAYAKQDEGLDTVDANLALGFEDDQRGYQMAADMLRDLGVASVALMTNNPRKVEGLQDDGIEVTRREPHEVEAHEHNREYLKTKQDRLGHLGTNGD